MGAAPGKSSSKYFLQDKLKVVRKFNKLKKERDVAADFVRQRLPHTLTQDQKDKFLAKRAKAKEVLKLNVAKECSKELGSKVLQHSQICRWAKKAEQEKWEMMLETDRVRLLEVPRSWRQKHALARKGRAVGGDVPFFIQQQLDLLIAEHVMGSSDITERKEVVSWRHIEPWTELMGRGYVSCRGILGINPLGKPRRITNHESLTITLIGNLYGYMKNQSWFSYFNWEV